MIEQITLHKHKENENLRLFAKSINSHSQANFTKNRKIIPKNNSKNSKFFFEYQNSLFTIKKIINDYNLKFFLKK